MNNTIPFNPTSHTVRTEQITVDVSILSVLNHAASPGRREPDTNIYLAAIAPDMELTVITLDEVSDILPCFDEDDAYLNIPATSLLLSYNPKQVLELGGRRYLTGPVILVRADMDVNIISLAIDEVYIFQKYLESHSVTLMVGGQKMPCICME